MNKAKSVAVILTYNEETNISHAVKNALGTFETVYILDSLSTDRTVEFAAGAGAEVIRNKFVNFAAQRNFALEYFCANFDWLFFLDADEEIDTALSENLKSTLSERPNNPIAFKMRRKNYFLGKKLRHVTGKDYQTRLFGDFGDLTYIGDVHEGVVASSLDRKIIQGCLVHRSQDTITELFAKTNRYTSLEVSKKKSYSTPKLITRLLYVPILTFSKSYFLRMGFLDGYQGFIYANFAAIYKFVLISKQIEKLLQK